MMKPKRSVIILNRVCPPHTGATGRMAENLARYLSAKGWEARIVSTGEKNHNGLKKDVFYHIVKANQNPTHTLSYLHVALKLFTKALFLKKADIVITLTDPPLLGILGRYLCLIKGSKHVHWCHDVYPDLLPVLNPDFSSRFYKSAYKQYRKALNKAARVIVIGRCMAAYLAQTGVKNDKMSVIPNWANPKIFVPEGKAKALLKAKTPLPVKMFRDDSPKFRILYAGNIGQAHEMQIILDAARQLQEHKEIEFVFVGSSQAHEALAAERSKEGLDNIKFMPYQPANALKNILESGDVHLVSMKNETRGLLVPCKFYGALAVGRPSILIGPQDSEIAKVLKEYKSGLCVDDGRPESLKDAILHYRHDGQAWFEAQEGAIKAAQHYNAQISLSYWHEELEKVLSLA